MPRTNTRPPIIVIGMLRSGTTMLTRMLGEMGVFVGKGGGRHCEARLFRRLNGWMFHQVSAGWDQPEPFHLLLENKEIRDLVTDYLRISTSSPRIASFLGWRRYLKYRSLSRLDIPWAWKDPRTTYTLPLWLDVFPNARVIHIVRHGVDVASSLKAMQQNQLARRGMAFRHRRRIYSLITKKRGFASLRCITLTGCFSLWEEYVERARYHLQGLGHRGLEIQYEDLLENPVEQLELVAHFAELNLSHSQIEHIASFIQSERAYAYRRDPSLSTFADTMSDRLRLIGYTETKRTRV